METDRVLIEILLQDPFLVNTAMGRSRTGPLRLASRKYFGPSAVGHRYPTFLQLIDGISARLKKLKYDQTPNLGAAAKILRQHVLWTRKGKAAKE